MPPSQAPPADDLVAALAMPALPAWPTRPLATRPHWSGSKGPAVNELLPLPTSSAPATILLMLAAGVGHRVVIALAALSGVTTPPAAAR